MSPPRSQRLLGLALVLILIPAAQAQQNAPHIGYVYPAGGRQGTDFEVTVGGQFLSGVSQAVVSGPGIEATVGEYVKPLTQMQFNNLRMRLQELQAKKKKDADTLKEIAEIRQKVATFVRKPSSPAIAETVTLQVKLAADAAPGQRELRLKTANGLTNPLFFQVGQLPEFSKETARTSGQTGAGKKAQAANQPQPSAPTVVMDFTPPAVVNGQIAPGGADRYRFKARKGQKLVVCACARELIPYLADAVPGWFQATVTLYNAAGKEVAYSDDYRFHPDPVLLYEVPADGSYALEIKDAIYRGREDFVYRITVGELPFLTSLFPLGGRAGQPTSVALTGWNLPVSSLTAGSAADKPGVQMLCVKKNGLASNCLPFAVGTLPESLDKEPNNQITSAQPVALPVVINGRVECARRLGRLPRGRSCRRGDRRRGDRAPARLAAGFRPEADRRHRPRPGRE